MEFVWISGLHTGFPGGSDSKESACNGGDLGWGTFPGGGHGNLLQYSCLENLHGQRSLVGDSPWGHKELGTAEQLSTAHDHTHTWSSGFSYFLQLKSEFGNKELMI